MMMLLFSLWWLTHGPSCLHVYENTPASIAEI